MRIGLLYAGNVWTTPWPSLIRWVRWESAASQISGAAECEKFSRKWCSTAQTFVKPTWSALTTCSVEFQRRS